jgi:hypothetical protein
MKKNRLVFLLLMTLLGACENDDFCAEETTPRLIIGFYDAENPEEFKTAPLFIWAAQKDTIYQGVNLDSISLPLNTNSRETTYKFSHSQEVDQINFSYDSEDVFVSESCGFKVIFKNLTLESFTNTWIESIDINNALIENEKQVHVKIFH